MTTVRPAGPVFCALAQGRRVVLVVVRAPPGKRRRAGGAWACGAVMVLVWGWLL